MPPRLPALDEHQDSPLLLALSRMEQPDDSIACRASGTGSRDGERALQLTGRRRRRGVPRVRELRRRPRRLLRAAGRCARTCRPWSTGVGLVLPFQTPLLRDGARRRRPVGVSHLRRGYGAADGRGCLGVLLRDGCARRRARPRPPTADIPEDVRSVPQAHNAAGVAPGPNSDVAATDQLAASTGSIRSVSSSRMSAADCSGGRFEQSTLRTWKPTSSSMACASR